MPQEAHTAATERHFVSQDSMDIDRPLTQQDEMAAHVRCRRWPHIPSTATSSSCCLATIFDTYLTCFLLLTCFAYSTCFVNISLDQAGHAYSNELCQHC